MREARRPHRAGRGRGLQHPEAHGDRGAHLHGGDTDLAVTLREVPVTGGEEATVDRDRQQQLRSLGELFCVEVAAVLPRRQCAQSLGGGGPTARNRIGGVVTFKSTAGLLSDLAKIMEQEQDCCSFLRIRLTMEASEGRCVMMMAVRPRNRARGQWP